MNCSINKGLWGSMANLNQAVSKAITAGASSGTSPESLEAANDLDIALQHHRATFISLLRNPHKSPSERASLQRAVQEAVPLPGYSMPMKLPETFVQEALIISDMFNISEMCAFSLLRSSEEEKTLYPGYPRGLVSVLFYYDSREQLANAFKTLVQARQGISWTLLPNNEELSITITRYLEPILNISCVDRLLEIINSMDLIKEIDLLQKNRALGNAKHRNMVIEKFKSVRLLLAETLFCWSAQTPLKRDECKRLIAHLSKVKLTETKDGSIDQVNLTLLLALLYSIDVSYLAASEDITEAINQFPITNDARFVPEIHNEIKDAEWESKGLLSVVQMAWSITLSSLKQLPLDNLIFNKDLYLDDDETVLDKAMKIKLFQFVEKSILSSENLPLETFHAQRIHGLLTDFITYHFDRVKLMKTMADENARKILANTREGLDPPANLDQPYEDLLNCLASLYQNGQCVDLVDDYWYDHLYASTPFKSHSSKQIALYRFVRLPGDFLPPSLFVPYLNFLCGISTNPRAAQNVYNFLRMNSQPAAQGSNLSWENFLNAFSQYYNNLRVQLPQSMHETVYQTSRSSLRCISPQELQGLTSVLKLLCEVSTHDESARIALCNNSAWSPIYVFTGLLTCSVPLSLKTWLFNSLASFSLSPSLGAKVWQAIESAKLVPSSEGAPGYSNRGLSQDIEEIESRCEEFPLSQSFLKLLIALVKAGIPNKSSSVNIPGCKPYYDIVKEQIFLPHDSRTYKRAGERWALSRKSMELFIQLLNDYQPRPHSLLPEDAWNHPSHTLLLDLIQDSKLLRQVLSILHDGVYLLEQYTTVPGQKDLEETLYLVLELLMKIYRLQRYALSRENKGDVVLMGIDRLLLTMNQRTGACDHMLNISHIIGHHATLPRHAALACQLINIISSSPSGQSHILPLLTSPSSTAIAFRQNFVQLLDHANLDEDHLKAAETALSLLRSNLQLPAPNLAHFLLGFVDGGSIGNSELRSDLFEPGVRGFPRTALHSVLAALPSLPHGLCEAAHNLLFILANNPATSAAILRYLSSHDFVHQSLSGLNISISDSPEKLLSTGWVLRIAALDLRYHSSHKQRSQLRRLISLLVTGTDPDPSVSTEPRVIDSSLSWNGLAATQEGRGILLTLLEVAELTVESPPSLHCQYLTRAPEMIKACEETVGNTKTINVTLLHELVYQLLQDPSSGGSVTQNDPLYNEVQEVLDHAVSLNQARRMLFGQRHFLESWRQLVEVVVAVSPAELTEMPMHQSFLHILTLELTRRLLDESALPELSSLLVSTLLLLVTTLRTIHTQTVLSRIPKKESQLEISPMLPSSLQLILRGLIDCLVRFKHGNQGVRASLYAALLNYLRIHADSSMNKEARNPNPSMLSAPKETVVEQFHRENYEVIREDLPQLVDILSCEATAGHVICKLLSLSCLDAIAALERRSSTALAMDSPLLIHLSELGHLRILLDEILLDDQSMINIISEGSADFRPLFLWETRASLLTRLSLTPSGARLLLQSGLLTRVSEMQVFKYHPSSCVDITLDNSEMEESCLHKVFSGAIMGAIRICMSVLTALGPNDDSAVSQVLLFLSSNVDSIAESMRIPSKSAWTGALSQLALLTSVVATASPPALYSDIKDPSALETAAQTKRLRKQLLSLLPHFCPDGRLGAFINELPQINEDGECTQEACRTFMLQIFTNCLVHARDHLLQDDVNSCDVTLLFQPTLDRQESTKVGRSLTLGMLIASLDQASQEFVKARSKKETASRKFKDIETAHYDSLRQFVSPSLVTSASPSTVRKLAAIYLDNIIQQYSKQEELSVHAVEASMLLLYRHLQFYLKEGEKIQVSKKNIDKNLQAILVNHMNMDQIKDLKTKMNVSVEEMLPRIKQVETLYSSATGHVPFLEGCITRIRWLLVS